jgi:hypothetical protein
VERRAVADEGAVFGTTRPIVIGLRKTPDIVVVQVIKVVPILTVAHLIVECL